MRQIFRWPSARYVALAGLFPATILTACTGWRSLDARLTVEITADGKVYTGSATQSAWCEPDFAILRSHSHAHCHLTGNAVAVDIPGRPTLYMLMRSPLPLADDVQTDYLRLLWRSRGGRSARQWQVPQSSWPVFALLERPYDPTSLQIVDPADLTGIYGDGVKVKSIGLQTGEMRTPRSQASPQTAADIENERDMLVQRLPWLTEGKGDACISGQTCSEGTPGTGLRYNAFTS